ncbi:hypothetical protein [Tepidiforma sp.]|uniref:hypothetical protein n=1 Tax=Tepidiforma sp. TaxID=2682230 RepID=UPI0026039BAA|nr:hypothetical protein [Tepidiforma sp.]MCX7619206.1 hypothetical protein [Tepidiforma sp.]
MAAAFQMEYKSLKERHFRTIPEPAGLVNLNRPRRPRFSPGDAKLLALRYIESVASACR